VIRRTPFFYGWVILLAGTLGIVMMGPSQTFTVSLFLDAFVQDLGISRANVSLLYGLATLGASFLLPITGRLVDAYGTRRLIVVTTVVFAFSVMSLSLVTGAVTLFAMLLAVRFLGFGSMQLISNNVIAQWFVRRRGFVMGLSGQSLAISLFIFPALSNFFIQAYGWRGAWIALGVVVLVVMLPVGWLFFRDRPELYGLLPDGAEDARSRAELAHEVHWTLAQARRTGVFWLFAAAFTTLAMITAGMVFHQASLFAVHGLDRTMAVYAFQMTALFSIAGNLGTGVLLDRVSARRLLTVMMVMLAAAMLLVMTLNNLVEMVAYAALLGLVTGSYRVMDGTVWAKYFGRRYLGSIRGATMLGTVGGTALGAYPLGLSYDLTGSYGPALLALLTLPAAIAVLAFMTRRPDRTAPGAVAPAPGEE
jgi:MFS family permease